MGGPLDSAGLFFTHLHQWQVVSTLAANLSIGVSEVNKSLWPIIGCIELDHSDSIEESDALGSFKDRAYENIEAE